LQGSRSYNLNVPGSDADMLVIAASPTEEIVSCDPPKQTIKNKVAIKYCIN
jgi:predicted nucleotidyltransferase